MARAAGLRLKEAFPLVYKGLYRVGIASAVYGTYNAAIVVHEGGESSREMVVLASGVIVGFAAAFTTGWIAVSFGAVSLGISIYQETN